METKDQDKPVRIFAGNQIRLEELLAMLSPFHIEDIDFEHRRTFTVHRLPS